MNDYDFIMIGICCDSHSVLCDKHFPYLYLEFSESLSGKVGCSSSIVDSSQCLIALKLERAITCDKVTDLVPLITPQYYRVCLLQVPSTLSSEDASGDNLSSPEWITNMVHSH